MAVIEEHKRSIKNLPRLSIRKGRYREVSWERT